MSATNEAVTSCASEVHPRPSDETTNLACAGSSFVFLVT